MADWSTPGIGDLKVDVLAGLKARDVDAISLSESITNPPTGAKRWVSASNKLQVWNGSAWVDLVLSLDSGGTGGTSASTARTALGIGTMGTQNSNAVSISGGAIAGLSSLAVSGNTLVSGILSAGSTPVVLTDSAGMILEVAIANGTVFPRLASSETITGVWNFATNPTFNNNAIPESKINNNTILARVADNETITGTYTFSTNPVFNAGGIPETALANGSTYARLADNETVTGNWSFSNNIGASINGNAATATILNTARQINGVLFNGSANITINAAASGLTGTSLAANVTSSSLTVLGLLTGLTVADGLSTAPSFRFSSNSNAGMYYNAANPTIEFGANFDDATHRGVFRSFAGPSGGKTDILVGSTFVATFQAGGISLGTSMQPNVANSFTIGTLFNPFNTMYAQNGMVTTSDIRHKRNHGPITNALDKIRRTETLIASWLQGPEDLRFPALSAQNIKEVWDDELGTEIVKVDQFDIHRMYSDRVIPGIIAALKELDGHVQELRTI